jgi:hypothetical protein
MAPRSRPGIRNRALCYRSVWLTTFHEIGSLNKGVLSTVHCSEVAQNTPTNCLKLFKISFVEQPNKKFVSIVYKIPIRALQ